MHSPIPWKNSDETLWDSHGTRLGAFDGYLPEYQSRNIDNARRAVRCVNLHDELVAALDAMTTEVTEGEIAAYLDINPESLACVKAARQLLAKVQPDGITVNLDTRTVTFAKPLESVQLVKNEEGEVTIYTPKP